MIHHFPVYRSLGECQLAVEFGDEADLRINFRVLALQDFLQKAQIPGLIELIPTMRTLGMMFDPDRLPLHHLHQVLNDALQVAQNAKSIPSRIVDMPVWYDDPGSFELAQRDGLPRYVPDIARMNGLDSVEAFIAKHTLTDQWVAAIGWAPGCTFAYPLDRTASMSSPKLVTPRTYAIPERYVTLGGVCTSITPLSLPSGYRTIGRLAIDIYSPNRHDEHYSESGVLFRAGDRQRYRSIGQEEYENIRFQIEGGRYDMRIQQAEFRLDNYGVSTNQ